MNGYGYVDSVLYIYSMVIGRDAHWDGAYLANLLVWTLLIILDYLDPCLSFLLFLSYFSNPPCSMDYQTVG